MRTFSFLPAIIIILLLFAGIIFILTKIFIKIFPNLQKYFYKIWLKYFGLVLLFPIGIVFWQTTDIVIFEIFYIIGAVAVATILINLLVLVPIFFIKFFMKNRWEKFLKIFTIFLLLSLNFYSLYLGFIPKITEYNITFTENHNFHGKKFVMIADTHYGYIHGELEAKMLTEKINEINPDFVLIAGDFFDGPKINFEKIAKIFDNIKAPIFYANGNHEEYGNTDEILRAISSTKIQILNNAITDFKGLQIAGVTYHETKNEENFENILQNLGIENTKPSILIKHEPKWHQIAEKYGVDLMVSGHTHRGQMWPISYIPEKIYGKYVYGLVENNGKYSITTSGVGNWGPPQRLWSQSEIVVVNIQ